MKPKAIKNIHFLKLLSDYSKNSPRQFKLLLELSNKQEITAISELIFNLLQGHLKCKGLQKKIERYKHSLRKLANKNYPDKEKRTIIKRGRGFIVPLLAATIPAIIQLFRNKS